MSTVSVLFKLCLYRSDLSSDNLNESFLVALVLSCVVFFSMLCRAMVATGQEIVRET